MASPSQFRQYIISQDEEGNNIEVTRSSLQVGVLAFDTQRQVFVHCHVLLEPLRSRRTFEERGRVFIEQTHSSRARLFEYGEDEGNAFYITENVDGETLRSYLASQAQLPVWLAMQLTLQVLEGVNELLNVGCPVSEHLMESIRVWQCGAQALKAQVADLPMIDELTPATIKPKQAKLLFFKEAEKLISIFCERLQSSALGDEATVDSADFAIALASMLKYFVAEAKSSYAEVVALFETRIPLPQVSELTLPLSPRALVASLLNCNQDMADSVMPNVRIQSQKIDQTNPYVLRGKLIKTRQQVAIELVPPERFVGKYPHESLSLMLNFSKIEHSPNLLPIVYLAEKNGVESMAEPVVEGVALSSVLETRCRLDPFEMHLVLTRLDVALRSLENARRETNRIRLEDIYLFTGLDVEKNEASNLLRVNLTEWPIFSIVLRSHLCMNAMAGRGKNPASFLPLNPVTKKDIEPLWNGGWMASLSSLLLGFSDGIPLRQRTGIVEMDAVFSLLTDEIKRTRKGNPSSRSVFLTRYTKEIEVHVPIDMVSAESWGELSGGAATLGCATDTKQGDLAPVIESDGFIDEADRSMIGFAEALIQYPATDEPAFHDGLRSLRASAQSLAYDQIESSWTTIHKRKPFWWYLLWVLGGSMVLGLGLAHISGRALWQTTSPSTSVIDRPIEVIPVSQIELPLAPSLASKTEIKKTLPTRLSLSELDLDRAALSPDVAKKNTPPESVATIPKDTPPVAKAVMEPSKLAEPEKSGLTAQLQALRKNGKILPLELRAEIEQAAQSGNKEAMLGLGNLLLRGAVEVRDERLAFKWYDKASKAGEPAAVFPLAECYLQGWGVAPDFSFAVDLLNKASAAGDAQAKDLLGVCYARGIGVAKDDAKAFALSTEAYVAGISSACGNLGAMYLRGQGTVPDAERAVKLFEEGAKKNHADSMLLYAQSLEYGTGTPVNPTEAKRWYINAAKFGNAEASNWCRKNNTSY